MSVFLCSNGLLHILIIRESLKGERKHKKKKKLGLQRTSHRGMVERVCLFLRIVNTKINTRKCYTSPAHVSDLGSAGLIFSSVVFIFMENSPE